MPSRDSSLKCDTFATSITDSLGAASRVKAATERLIVANAEAKRGG